MKGCGQLSCDGHPLVPRASGTMGAISTRATRWVLKHHGHTNKETRVWVKRLVVVVVVVVLTVCLTCVSVHIRPRDAPNWVAERLGPSSRRPHHPRALDDEELFIIEGSPGAQLRDTGGARKMPHFTAKIPSPTS